MAPAMPLRSWSHACSDASWFLHTVPEVCAVEVSGGVDHEDVRLFCCVLCRRHQVTIIVEPKVFQELVDAGRVIPLAPSQQQQQQQPKGPVSNSSSSDDAAASGSSGGKVVTHSGSSSSLAGMLISTSPGQASPQSAGLFPVCSWAGPSTSGSNGGSSGGHGLAAVPPAAGAGAVVGAGGAAAGVIKTWQPELRVDQSQEGQDPEQQQQQGDNASGGSSLLQESDLIPDAVAQQLDLVVVLGGDGTVLWTCHIFGNRCECLLCVGGVVRVFALCRWHAPALRKLLPEIACTYKRT